MSVSFTNSIHSISKYGIWSYPLSLLPNGDAPEKYLELFDVPFEHPAYPQKGVRAKKDIPKGTCIGYYAGDQISSDTDTKGNNYVFEYEDKMMDGEKRGNLTRFINDPIDTGKLPNVAVLTYYIEDADLVTSKFETSKKVKKGEELLYKYEQNNKTVGYWEERKITKNKVIFRTWSPFSSVENNIFCRSKNTDEIASARSKWFLPGTEMYFEVIPFEGKKQFSVSIIYKGEDDDEKIMFNALDSTFYFQDEKYRVAYSKLEFTTTKDGKFRLQNWGFFEMNPEKDFALEFTIAGDTKIKFNFF